MAALGIEERFWSHVDATGDCWLWAGSCDTTGYGHFWFRGKLTAAHRVAYMLLVGSIPPGQQLDHLCRIKRCVNLDHVQVVDQRTNILRGYSRSAQWARRTHCLKGHEYTPENTYNYSKRRECKTCHHARLAVLYREKWAAERAAKRGAAA